VVLDGVDHLRAEHVAHELGARQGEHRAQRRTGQHDRERQENVAEAPLHQGGIVVEQKPEDFHEAFAPAGIDDMVGAS
jgi:hypothetical protein